MWSSSFDLHCHTTHSDGALSVDQLADEMVKQQVEVWSLTDHDTIAGWDEARAAASKRGIKFIPGVELTCDVELPWNEEILEANSRHRPPSSWHLLAYFPTIPDPEGLKKFEDWLSPLHDDRVPRMLEIIDKVNAFGMNIEVDDVLSRAQGSVGRPHLAMAMVDAGYVESMDEAFEKWLGDGRPCNVERPKPSLAEASALVHAAGGVTSLAHPRYYGVDYEELIQHLKVSGVDAIEAFHRSHSDEDRHRLWKLAQKHGLGVTVGSDFHSFNGGHRPGHMPVVVKSLPELIASV
ncbi:MAG: PHP domain-containing protein [Candidatus Thermoplasmatota archaeon]|nr:PHP domain-containing protein [Candidatus Thermoplasmatota archaeon]MEC8609888.1 PHP domain-containing protein [Candidatus Thermoplasmatota archaeon]